MRILITGGAGFVGSSLAHSFVAENLGNQVVVFDNLKRRGSEMNLPLFKRMNIDFYHGDIRNIEDLHMVPGEFDVMIDASAEPSVLAGTNGSPQYLLQTNLGGTMNCLEYCRHRVDNFIFLSTSRVYSIEPMRNIKLLEAPTRFTIAEEQNECGITKKGISEEFPTHKPRSLYGASKLASEMIIQEYALTYGLKAIINRCGVIAGPGQFGKVDQGVFTLWVANHYFKKPLAYTGFGGSGKQVRDLLHPKDLFSLIKVQLKSTESFDGSYYNVGGGLGISISLHELTAMCQNVVGNRISIKTMIETSRVDIPLYISDYTRTSQDFGWRPKISVNHIVEDITNWIRKNEAQLRHVFNGR